jgi:hypothetical protein
MAISSVVTNSLAKICQYLVGNQSEIQQTLFNGSINNNTAMILYMERKGVEYGIAQNLDDLQQNTNYLYSLLGGNLNQANNILTGGGGGINAGSIQNSNGGLTPYPINLEISAGQAGVSTISNPSWVGLAYINSAVINSVVYQESVGFTFNSATGSFDFTLSGYVFQEGDDFNALGFLPVTSSGGGGGSVTPPMTATANAVGGTTTINIPILQGKTVNLVFRGTGIAQLIPLGVPTGNEIRFDSTTGDLFVGADNPFVDDELITAQYY